MPFTKKYLGTVREDNGDKTHFFHVQPDEFISFSRNDTPQRISYVLDSEHTETAVVGDPVIVDGELHFMLYREAYDQIIDCSITPGVEGFATIGVHDDFLL